MLNSVVTNRWAMAIAMVLCLTGGVFADETRSRLSQSVEGPAAQVSENQAALLDKAPMNEAAPLVTTGSRVESPAQQRLAAHPGGLVFSIFDAHTELSLDDDVDGFYHRLRVNFDADVDGSQAWVFARLYLSLEGGPWNHYHTTEVFSINGDANDDDYEVVTRLLDGYPTGYYDVLIELYDADYNVLVVNYGPYEDRDLAVLPLEDIYRDGYYEYGYDGYNGGGGALGPGLLLLVLLAVAGFASKQRQPV